MLTALTALLLSSSLYDVTCLERGPDFVRVRITATHPDVEQVPEDVGFALSLLLDAANVRPLHFPLLREVDFEDVGDDAWLAANARGFVKSVTLAPSKDPRVRELRVQVTDPAWNPATCAPGTMFESASFEHDELTFAPAAPRHPGKRPAPLPPGSEGFLAVPRSLFEPIDGMAPLFPVPPGPEVFEVPAFGPASYESSPSTATEQLGRPTMARTRYELVVGSVVAVDGTSFRFAQVSGSGGWHLSSNSLSNVEALRYAPIVGQRKRTSFLKVLANVHTTLKTPKVEGRQATFEARVVPDGRKPPAWSAETALLVLVRPVLDLSGKVLSPCPLATEVQRVMKESRVGRSEAIAALAPKLIKKSSLVFGEPARDPKTVTPSEERAWLEQPWPKGTLMVEVTDARWLSHLPVAPPRVLENY
jgi:hypothetical protein